VLQAEKLAPSRAQVVERLTRCGRDWIVLDAVFNSEVGGKWTAAEVRKIRTGKAGRKVLAYLSIGEAEDFRPYWKKSWKAKPPAFLGPENPDWKGNYRVRYWQAPWQRLILSAVDDIVARGFDGVYLDTVDTFEFFEYDSAQRAWRDDAVNAETGRTFRQDMIEWVRRVARRGRSKRPNLLVIPQNGASLLAHASYARMVDGIGIEDLFTNGNRLQDPDDSAYVKSFLDRLRVPRPIILIEYGSKAAVRKRSIESAKRAGYVLLLTDRELKTLGEAPQSK
jgi:cysteinyl-tRNA synthetase